MPSHARASNAFPEGRLKEQVVPIRLKTRVLARGDAIGAYDAEPSALKGAPARAGA
jgi:hypothetical protein